jgi:hypothetical protein
LLQRCGDEVPWEANGNYYSFKEESIGRRVLPVSGVYGLYTIKQQVFIGASADIRAALLHHKKTGFCFGRYRPTRLYVRDLPGRGESKAGARTHREYRPTLQTGRPFLFRRWTPRKH